jgi:hypothetical protein
MVSDELLKRLRRIWPVSDPAAAAKPAAKPAAKAEEEPQRPGERSCVDCGVAPPATESEYTLISAQHGWRLSRGVNSEGRTRLDWRCPKCWAKRRSVR